MVPKIKATHGPRAQAQGTGLETGWRPPWGMQKRPHRGTQPIMMSWFPPRLGPRAETKPSGPNW